MIAMPLLLRVVSGNGGGNGAVVFCDTEHTLTFTITLTVLTEEWNLKTYYKTYTQIRVCLLRMSRVAGKT